MLAAELEKEEVVDVNYYEWDEWLDYYYEDFYYAVEEIVEEGIDFEAPPEELQQQLEEVEPILGPMCVNNMKNQIYMQFVCDEEDDIKEKQQISVSVAFLAFFIGVTFARTMSYLNERMHLDNEEWDIKNTTVGDYSVEVTISPMHWYIWRNKTFDENESRSFKEHFKNELIEHMKK